MHVRGIWRCLPNGPNLEGPFSHCFVVEKDSSRGASDSGYDQGGYVISLGTIVLMQLRNLETVNVATSGA